MSHRNRLIVADHGTLYIRTEDDDERGTVEYDLTIRPNGEVVVVANANSRGGGAYNTTHVRHNTPEMDDHLAAARLGDDDAAQEYAWAVIEDIPEWHR